MMAQAMGAAQGEPCVVYHCVVLCFSSHVFMSAGLIGSTHAVLSSVSGMLAFGGEFGGAAADDGWGGNGGVWADEEDFDDEEEEEEEEEEY